MVSVAAAPTILSLYSACASASSLATNLVPIQAPAAPRASTAASPRPSAMPPAATTGVPPAASTTEGTRGRVATDPMTWPPASHPCATRMSTPWSTAVLAWSALPTVSIATAPASWTLPRNADGSPQKNDTTGTPSSRQTSRRLRMFQARTRLTPNGLSVSSRVRRRSGRISSGFRHVADSIPSAPAFDTAATSSGQVRLPIGAWTIGTSMPRSRVSAVSNMGRAYLLALLLELGDDGEMIRRPDAVHRGGAAQRDRLHAATALPVRADQDVVDPRIREDGAGLVTVSAVPGETGIAGIGVAPRVDENQPRRRGGGEQAAQQPKLVRAGLGVEVTGDYRRVGAIGAVPGDELGQDADLRNAHL